MAAHIKQLEADARTMFRAIKKVVILLKSKCWNSASLLLSKRDSEWKLNLKISLEKTQLL